MLGQDYPDFEDLDEDTFQEALLQPLADRAVPRARLSHIFFGLQGQQGDQGHGQEDGQPRRAVKSPEKWSDARVRLEKIIVLGDYSSDVKNAEECQRVMKQTGMIVPEDLCYLSAEDFNAFCSTMKLLFAKKIQNCFA